MRPACPGDWTAPLPTPSAPLRDKAGNAADHENAVFRPALPLVGLLGI